MVFDASTAEHLKPWLTKTLEPMSVRLYFFFFYTSFAEPHYFIWSVRCDADPSALADYILALLKHNGPEPELRKELSSQLDEFLEKGASPVTFSFPLLLNVCDVHRGPSFHRRALHNAPHKILSPVYFPSPSICPIIAHR